MQSPTQAFATVDAQLSSAWLSTPSDPEPSPALQALVPISNERRTELDSLLRAMPLSRLLSNGMEYADASNLQSMVRAGIDWTQAGTWLGNRNVRLAKIALEEGYLVTARQYFQYASACFRFAQNAISLDTEEKKHIYREMVDSFAQACKLSATPTEQWKIPYENGQLCGWLMRPADVPYPPAVIVIGGFDGWREEHHCGAMELIERGIAVLLVDAPGQGETRLFHDIYLKPDVHRAISRMIDALSDDPRIGERFGICGNSFGGFLAAYAAIADERIVACCVNGGTVRPLEFPERYPRFFNKAEAMLGTTDRQEAISLMSQLDISATVKDLRCSLLQLHSTHDPVFSLENARLLHDRSSSKDKKILIWSDGDHCIYNHAHERNSVVSDWFNTRLAPGRIGE